MSNTKKKTTQSKNVEEKVKKTTTSTKTTKTNNKPKTNMQKSNQSKSNQTKTNTQKTNKPEEKKVKDIEIKEDKTLSQDFNEEKENKVFIKVVNIVLWIVLFVWMGMCLYDFYTVKAEKKPVFCIKEETIQYEDGTVISCLGPGYKVYRYKRDSYKGIEFGPIWAKDRSNKEAE